MRSHRLAYAAICGALAAAIACSKGGTEHLSDLSTDLDGGDVILGPDNKPVPTGAAGTGLATGLPCDVQAVVENRCKSCHEGMTAGAPRLLDYADFKQPSKADPTKTMAEMSLIRMKNGQMPPAPAEPPNDDEIQIFEDWVTGGTQKGGLCTDPPPDGGTDAGNIGDASDDGCASGSLWTMGNTGSPNMHPGEACNACHSGTQGPNLTFAGTVYRGGVHDVDDCDGTGTPAPLLVIITDKNGQTATLTVNDAGNFELEAPKRDGGADGGEGGRNGGGGGGRGGFRAPFHAKVVSGNNQHFMVGSVTSGDCNTCHSAQGINGAPGRILAP